MKNKKICWGRILILLLGCIGLVLFLIPLFRGSKANIGGNTGIACSLVLILYGAFAPRVKKMIGWLYRKLLGRLVCDFAMIAVLLITIMTVAETISMCSVFSKPVDRDAVVVVLGCRIYGDKASKSMVERLDAAYEYLNENKEAPCILSGGQGQGEDISEAQCMYEYLVEKGVDKGRLYMEDQSTDTYENLQNVAVIMEEHNWGNSIAIVTSEYHEYRSSLIASEMGLESCAIPARTAWWLFPTYYVRELYGILHQWMFGR